MKNLIKIFFVLAFVFGASGVFASGPFNGQSGDCPSMGIGVYPDNIQRDNYGCWTATHVSADAGDTVNVSMWYHNNTANNLTNVRASLSQSSHGPTTQYTFSGNMYSNQGNTSLGTVSLSLSSSQTLTYQSAHWMKDKYAIDNDIDTALLNMANGAQATLGNGIVPPGWYDYGQIIIVFKVGNNSSHSDDCSISNFTANGSTTAYIDDGDSVDLEWDTDNCDSVNITSLGNVNLSGNETVYPSSDRTYTLTAYDQNSVAQTRSVHVYVDDDNNNDDDCEIEEFTIDGSSSSVHVDTGDSVNIVWETNNCRSVEVDGPDFDSNDKDGDEDFDIEDEGTYWIKAYGYDGSYQSESIRVYLDEENDRCEIVDFYASTTSSVAGQPVVLSWETDNCDYVNISNVGSYLPASYSRIIYPTSTKTYTLKAYGEGRDPEDDLKVYVNNYTPTPVPTPTYSCAVTTVATNVGSNSATLNGIVNGQGGNTYFEYGKTVEMNYRTTARSVGSGSVFNETISGLSAKTIYFYRLVADCGGGISKGSIEVLETLGSQVIRPTVIQGTTVIGTNSPIMLKIENRYQLIRVGDIVDYTITYKNIGSKKLTNSLLQVILPKGVSFSNSSEGTYAKDTHTLTSYLGELDPGENGVLYVQGKVNSLDRNNNQVVTTALLVYTSSKGAQENAIAYVLNNPNYNENNLAAGAFFSGFLGLSLIGWLLLIIIILLIILIVRRYYYREDNYSAGHH